MRKVIVIAEAFLTLLFALFMLAQHFGAFLAKPPAVGVVPPNSIFHRPRNGPCPVGTTPMPGFFEKDGAPSDACLNPKGDGSIDYLNPGEGFTVGVPLEEERTSPPGKKL